MSNDLRNLSLDNLFGKLHGLMVNLVKDVDSVLEDNKEVGMGSVKELREHITAKLSKNEEIQDNDKLLKLLNLFSEDRAVLEIIREDAEEWVQLLNAIEENIKGSGATLTKKEQEEIHEINRLTSEIKTLIRK